MFGLIFTVLLLAFAGVAFVYSRTQIGPPQMIARAASGGALALGLLFGWVGSMFYAEPGYMYHVRTIFGEEKVVNDVGWNGYYWGYRTPWKKALSVQSVAGVKDTALTADDSDTTSAALPLQEVVFLDQVHAEVTASARFRLPEDPVAFLQMAHEYRTPDNLLMTSLIPAFGETLRANAMLMGAEEFYSGGQTQFISDFDSQLKRGTYIVHRKEIRTENPTAKQSGSADTARENNQRPFGDDTQIIVKMEKEVGPDGVVKVKSQKFIDYGIQVVEARVVNVDPSKTFKERMQAKQNAAAAMAVARQDKLKEEELKQAAIAKGQRVVAERQQELLKDQVEKTTAADTDKSVALTEASKLRERAEIERDAAKITLERDKLLAQAIKVSADAEAYKLQNVNSGVNALDKKLAAEIEIQKVWAEAFSKRNVPQTVFGASSGSGLDNDAKVFMQMMTLDAAKRLNYDRDPRSERKE